MHASVCETSLYKLKPLYAKCHTADNIKQHTEIKKSGPPDTLKGMYAPEFNLAFSLVLKSACEYCAGNLRAVNTSV